LVALVHIAVFRYMSSKKLSDVSEALERLLRYDIAPLLDPCIFGTTLTNAYRERCCYTREVDATLRRHEPSLRELFKASCRPDAAAGREKTELMSFDEFKALMRGLSILADGDVSERQVSMCFSWSRMAVIDSTSDKGRLKETHLPFEGFLEALCRLGGMAALPTDDEISAAGCSDAGASLNYLRAQDENQYKQLKAERAAEWGSSPKQPLSRCVDHLCAVMIRKAEAGGGAQSSKDLQLSTKEARAFVKRCVVFANQGGSSMGR